MRFQARRLCTTALPSPPLLDVLCCAAWGCWAGAQLPLQVLGLCVGNSPTGVQRPLLLTSALWRLLDLPPRVYVLSMAAHLLSLLASGFALVEAAHLDPPGRCCCIPAWGGPSCSVPASASCLSACASYCLRDCKLVSACRGPCAHKACVHIMYMACATRASF
jgi:hypothetical protein